MGAKNKIKTNKHTIEIVKVKEIRLQLPPTDYYWCLCRVARESPLEALDLFYLEIAPALEGCVFVLSLRELP